MIRELVEGGTTVLLTTQYLEEADRLAHSIAVIDRGKVIAEGTPEELKSRLGTTVVELGFADWERATRAAQRVSQAVSDPLERESELIRITSNDGSRVLIDALRSLDGADLTPTTVAVREPSLDDVFLTLTGRHAEPIDAQTSTSNRGGV